MAFPGGSWVQVGEQQETVLSLCAIELPARQCLDARRLRKVLHFPQAGSCLPQAVVAFEDELAMMLPALACGWSGGVTKRMNHLATERTEPGAGASQRCSRDGSTGRFQQTPPAVTSGCMKPDLSTSSEPRY